MEVGPSVFFSLLVIAVAFLPVFTLVDQEGRLFKPLAYTKTLTMALAALLAVTLDPAVRMLFTRMDPFTWRPRWLAKFFTTALVGKYYPEEKHPVSRVLFRLYEKPCRWVLRHPKTVIALSVLIVASTLPVYLKLGSEFMPPLNEGDAALHADHAARPVRHRSAAADANPGPHLEGFPGGRTGVRQSRPGRHIDRSRAVLDDGNHRVAQAARGMARETPFLFLLARAVARRAGTHLARAHFLGRTGR